MTRKSIIGFGPFKNTTVQNLLSQMKFDALLSIYYNLELVTFERDVLDELNICGNRIIDKPGKNKAMADKYIVEMSNQLREIHGLYKQHEFTENPMNNFKKRASAIRQIRERSKMGNKNRIQRTSK